MSCFVYLIQSKVNKSYYVGISENPEKRLTEHNSGKLKTTSKNKPFKLIYKKEYENYIRARKHEIWLKKKDVNYKLRLAQLAPPDLGGVK